MDKDSKGQRKLEDSRRTEEKYNRMEQNVIEITELNRRTIMIALKCANRDFFFTISLRRELPPTRTLKRPGRNRVQIACNTLGTAQNRTEYNRTEQNRIEQNRTQYNRTTATTYNVEVDDGLQLLLQKVQAADVDEGGVHSDGDGARIEVWGAHVGLVLVEHRGVDLPRLLLKLLRRVLFQLASPVTRSSSLSSW